MVTPEPATSPPPSAPSSEQLLVDYVRQAKAAGATVVRDTDPRVRSLVAVLRAREPDLERCEHAAGHSVWTNQRPLGTRLLCPPCHAAHTPRPECSLCSRRRLESLTRYVTWPGGLVVIDAFVCHGCSIGSTISAGGTGPGGAV